MNISNEIFEEVKVVAEQWQKQIQVSRHVKEKHFHEMMLKMLDNPMNKIFLIELLDQSFRSKDSHRVVDQLEYIFQKYENTDFFSNFEQILIWFFRNVGIYVSSISTPLFISYLRNDISSIVIKGEDNILNKHIQERRDEGTRVNVNVIGEIVLSHEESEQRVQKYINILENENIDYLSIKISNLFSQIIPHAHEYNIEKISYNLEKIYDSAMNNLCKNQEYKFVNLDMEEYRDLELTVDVFKQTLSKEKYKKLSAGIVMQAYLPDTFAVVKELASWAKQRVQNGGAPIKVRLVKGANQEMEMTEASLQGWTNVTYLSKAQTDANYKVIMDFLLSIDVAPYVNVGIASHNLFDHALAMLLAKDRGVSEFCIAEMLEGMSESAYRTLKDYGLNIILYAPTATKETFTNAIAYLVRRFDENTAEQNFLRHSFGLEVKSLAWNTLIQSYEDAISCIKDLKLDPYRTQDRNKPIAALEIDLENYYFENESDTDFVLKANREWAQAIKEKWKNISKYGGYNAYPVIGGLRIESSDTKEVIDKSQLVDNVVVGKYTKANKKDLFKAINVAKSDPDGWRDLDSTQRQKILMNVAQKFREKRADLIGIAAAEASKVFTETDVEISEAIDFLNFYPYSARKINDLTGISTKGKGVGLVVSPWNFPIAIPAGGVAAALSAGNTVILKPSSETVLCAYMLCECFWEAGVSKNTLQFTPTDGALAGEVLIKSQDINFTIFTGSEKTAYDMIKLRPDIKLSAETGGKDATIVTALSDRDQAIKNIVVSAFHNSGQKCSATSLLVLEKEVYEDEVFKKTLIDATASLEVGSVWDFKNRVSALINKPSGNLKKSLSFLDNSEKWAIKPDYENNNPYMLKPSIRWGTQVGDFCHKNELFGPVLSVMCADDLEDAVNIVNETGYGLTSGLESLDKREQEYFKKNLHAGNLYINRSTTGAIVTRQPFGGMGKSAIGSGKKAGGFNYVSQFMNIKYKQTNMYETCSNLYLEQIRIFLTKENIFTKQIENAFRYSCNFLHWYEIEFLKEHDYAHIRGQSNLVKYLPVKSVLLRIEDDDTLDEVLASIIAIKIIGAKLHISIPLLSHKAELIYLESKQRLFLDEDDKFSRDDEDSLAFSMLNIDRVRYLKEENVPKGIYERVAKNALYIASDPFVSHGRIEMMHYFVEQSISDSFHRYGNLGLHGSCKIEESIKKNMLK